jgi:maltooligosyltrehalose synthase
MSAFRVTYRVRFRPGFGFQEAAGLAGYFAHLGISHLYTSLYL